MKSPMQSVGVTDAALLALSARMAGEVAVPSDERWDAALQAWNLALRQQPRAVALPETAGDVRLVVGLARRHGLRVAVQHASRRAAPLAALEHTIVLRTELLSAGEIAVATALSPAHGADPPARSARAA